MDDGYYWADHCPVCGAGSYFQPGGSFCSDTCRHTTMSAEDISAEAAKLSAYKREEEEQKNFAARLLDHFNEEVLYKKIVFPIHKLEQCFGDHYLQGLFIDTTFTFSGIEFDLSYSLSVVRGRDNKKTSIEVSKTDHVNYKQKHFSVYITVQATNRDYVALARDYESLIKLVRRRCGFTIFSNDDIRTENDGEYVRL